MKLSDLEFGQQFRVKGLTVTQTFLGPDGSGKYFYSNPVHMRVHPGYIQSLTDCEVETAEEPGMFKVVIVFMLLILLSLLGLAIK